MTDTPPLTPPDRPAESSMVPMLLHGLQREIREQSRLLTLLVRNMELSNKRLDLIDSRVSGVDDRVAAQTDELSMAIKSEMLGARIHF